MKTSKLIKTISFNAPIALIEAFVNDAPSPNQHQGYYRDYFLNNPQEYLESYRNTLDFDLYYVPYVLKLKMVKELNLPREKGKLSTEKLNSMLSEYFYGCAEIKVGLVVQATKLTA